MYEIIMQDHVSNNDVLVHKSHKYIYKKKVNGKWRYYYDVGKANWKNGNTNIGEDGQSTDSNIRGYTKLQDIMGFDEREKRNRAVANYENAKQTYENHQNMSVRDLYSKNISIVESGVKEQRAGKDASRAISEFNKTPLGKLEAMHDTIQKGKNKVADLLEKAAKNLRN